MRPGTPFPNAVQYRDLSPPAAGWTSRDTIAHPGFFSGCNRCGPGCVRCWGWDRPARHLPSRGLHDPPWALTLHRGDLPPWPMAPSPSGSCCIPPRAGQTTDIVRRATCRLHRSWTSACRDASQDRVPRTRPSGRLSSLPGPAGRIGPSRRGQLSTGLGLLLVAMKPRVALDATAAWATAANRLGR